MNKKYRSFFGFEREPFPTDIDLRDILLTDELSGVWNRFQYAINLGAIVLITGDVGSGKSTALKYSVGQLHPSEYKVFQVTATSGSILELYKQILGELGVEASGSSRATLTKRIKQEFAEWVHNKKMKAILIIDEASLLRLEVYKELHTLLQFCQNTGSILPVILSGQANLIDNLSYRTSAPLASRIVGRSHLEGVDLNNMGIYIDHQLKIAGIKTRLFDDSAIMAIHQGSGGLFRKANNLARGALVAASIEETMSVNAEHVRLASTELF
jgi:type II secretory pathway predicted ATPase ExeA